MPELKRLRIEYSDGAIMAGSSVETWEDVTNFDLCGFGKLLLHFAWTNFFSAAQQVS